MSKLVNGMEQIAVLRKNSIRPYPALVGSDALETRDAKSSLDGRIEPEFFDSRL